MVCATCGLPTVSAGRCSTCGSVDGQSNVTTGVLALDTTGLPPGATAGTTVGGHSIPIAAGPLRAGQSFGPRYHIIKLLGAGGMGAVYQAWDAELNVAVALKVIRAHNRFGTISTEAEKRFKNELLLARQVTHKNVVRIHDLGEIDGIKYITMPYVQGEDLATTLRRDGKLAVPLAMRIARQIAAGLEAAHEAGVVHRDLKPANVMITLGPEDVHAQIMDFGISASASEALIGGLIGTFEYMAPEQGAGLAVDARADIYAFGLILYEMLTGPRPIVARLPQQRLELMQQRCREGLPPLRSLEPSVPEPLETLVTRCLAIDPAARYQDTHELVAALAGLDDAGEAIPEARKLTPRLMALVAGIVVLLLGGTYFVAWRANQVPKPHDPVSVVIADFDNRTGDAAFDRTLEPMVRRALEDTGFISAYDRSTVARTLGVAVPGRFDAGEAGKLAVNQGLGVVLAGFIEERDGSYRISMNAAQALNGKTVASAQATATSRDRVLDVATRLVANVRSALGDSTSQSKLFERTSLSATSLEVARHYTAAQEASANANFELARKEALAAIAIEPTFGVGYQLLAVVSRNLGNLQESVQYSKKALQFLDNMTERERYSTRGFYYRVTGDYQKCVNEYGEMIKRYAADVVGHNQLALCLTQLRDMKGAVKAMQTVVTLLPRRILFRDNLALYASYAGDFRTAEKEAGAIQEPDPYATLALAFAQIGQGQLAAATASYERLRGLNAVGASLAASGLADLASVEGRFGEAVRILRAGAQQDLALDKPDRAAAKLLALGYAQLSAGNTTAARDAAREALTHSTAVKTRLLAGRIAIQVGDLATARELTTQLGREFQAEPQAYSKILEGDAALAAGDAREAIRLLGEANGLLDTWIGHFDLGRAYLAAQAYPQADSEFDRCLTRRGEALALFLDEEPTYAYLPQVYYYQGLVREGLGTAGFKESYRAYLALRGNSKEDPLLADVRRRTQ